MKSLTRGLALSVALCATLDAMAFTDPLDQPARLSERAVRSALYGLAASASTHIVAVGPRGHILHSDDGGDHFLQSEVPLSSDLVSVCLVNGTLAWAVGHDGVILHSTDGGSTWTRQLDGRQLGPLAVEHYARLPATTPGLDRAREYAAALAADGPTKPLFDIYFEDATHGWAVGAYNLILHTEDGGQHWVPWMERTENPDEYSLHAIRNIAGQIYVAGEFGLLLRLERDSQRFVKLQTPYTGSFFGITGDQASLVVYGLRGNAWASNDQGSTWRQLQTHTANAINAGTLLADGRLALATSAGELLVGDLQGGSLQLQPRSPATPVYGLSPTASGLLTVGPDGVKRLSLEHAPL
ncbi:WD40/YVTN/BNR-like repeat-containing protein [Pseudomonas putida]|uniref:Photosynthesis system II assembly factor Ycf48/Hcf136-like domain-containing protein n=1 Tax=Pseudomonas putida TaxID=303 RepID=A0A177SUY1_PSEPU|nr:YCF48-related protein [Pseudomonas putida]OAI94755.1 hypothetical protein AYO28_06915 [Pseudomonas putida]